MAPAACGPGAVGFAEGDRVWCNSLGHGGRQGSFAQHVVVAAERLYHLPAGIDPTRAVAVLHPAGTGCLGLFREARLRPGDTSSSAEERAAWAAPSSNSPPHPVHT